MFQDRALAAMGAALLAAAMAVAGARAATMIRSDPEAVALDRIVLTDGGGDERTLRDVLPDGPIILHVWGTWCVPCRDELPALDRFSQDLAERNLAASLVVVSIDRLDHEKVVAFLRDELGLQNVPAWQGRRIGPAFRLFFFPSTVFLDAQHRLVARHPGALDWDDPHIRSELISHLEGR